MVDKKKIEQLTKEFLLAIGENPERSGLEGTPKRVSEMCEELFSGMNNEPENLVTKFTAPSGENNIIEVDNIPVYSLCEHHLLPFFGSAKIRYIPRNGQVLGLSKFARIVDFFARKLQVQENLTFEIAEYLCKTLNPKGIEITLRCTHTCMTVRGVKASESITTTSIKRGEI